MTALLALNLSTFPTPPGEAGLIDLGPLLGIWYLLVTIKIELALRWVKEQQQSKAPDYLRSPASAISADVAS